MRTRRHFLGAGLGVLAAPAILRGETVVRLRLAHALPPVHPVHAAMESMAAQARERSGGAIEIAIFANGELGQEPQILEQVRAGRLDLAKLSTSVLDSIAPAYRVFGLPFVIRDRNHWRAVASRGIGEEILGSTLGLDLVGLTFYQAGARSFYGRTAVNHPGDLRGRRIRIQSSPIMHRMVTLLDAQPVQLAWDVIYSALQTGLIDGAENSLAALIVGRHGEVARHYAFDEHTSVPDVLLASNRRWASLTPAHRGVIQEAARDSFERMEGLWDLFEKECRETAERMGVSFTYPDKTPFMERTAPLRAEFADPHTQTLLARIEREA